MKSNRDAAVSCVTQTREGGAGMCRDFHCWFAEVSGQGHDAKRGQREDKDRVRVEVLRHYCCRYEQQEKREQTHGVGIDAESRISPPAAWIRRTIAKASTALSK